jgi:hypothetical protein
VFNFSRAIIYAYKSEKFGTTDGAYPQSAAQAAAHYRDSLNEALGAPA